MSYKPFTKFSAAKAYFVQTINSHINIGVKDNNSFYVLIRYAELNEKDNLTAARFLIDNYNKIINNNVECKVGV